MSHTYLESHGVKLDVEIEDEALLPAVRRILPPGWSASDEFPEDGHFTIRSDGRGTFDVLADGSTVSMGVSSDLAVQVLDAQLRARIALLAQGRVFVHAGVVAVDSCGIVLPGPSFSGKSALVAELVSHGAEYLSDEFAVVAPDGMLHPYPKPLSLRADDARYGDLYEATSLGGKVASGPVRVRVIAITRYVPGARWSPERRPPGIGALAMLTNAVPARMRSEEATRAVARAAGGATVLEGVRGDADEAAAELMATVASLT